MSVEIRRIRTLSPVNRTVYFFVGIFLGISVGVGRWFYHILRVKIHTITEKVRATMLMGHSGQKQDRIARIR